jgi:hypothetical protein
MFLPDSSRMFLPIPVGCPFVTYVPSHFGRMFLPDSGRVVLLIPVGGFCPVPIPVDAWMPRSARTLVCPRTAGCLCPTPFGCPFCTDVVLFDSGRMSDAPFFTHVLRPKSVVGQWPRDASTPRLRGWTATDDCPPRWVLKGDRDFAATVRSILGLSGLTAACADSVSAHRMRPHRPFYPGVSG